jgi:type IV secretory pathway VirJ component
MFSPLGLEPKPTGKFVSQDGSALKPSESATPLAPEFAKIPGELIQCRYGVEEKDSGCPDLADKRSESIRTSGAYHFGRDYDAIAKDILDGLRRGSAF